FFRFQQLLEIIFKGRRKDPAVAHDPGAIDSRKELAVGGIKRHSLIHELRETLPQRLQTHRMADIAFNLRQHSIIKSAVLVESLAQIQLQLAHALPRDAEKRPDILQLLVSAPAPVDNRKRAFIALSRR